jgi:predicted deacylase
MSHIPRIPGIDFSAPGKQLGYLEVEHSDNQNDAAIIPSPLAVISGGQGPTVLLMAGTHGDEYEGQVLLQELIRNLEPEDVSGRIIILPALNISAVREGKRVSEVDGVNLNRAMPGKADGGPTQQIASIVTEDLIPLADYIMDIHSGGSVSEYVPSAFVYLGPTPELWAHKVAAVQAFNVPYSVVVKPMLKPGSISGAADKAGVPMISTELGGCGTVSLPILRRARVGLKRLLAHWGVLREAPAAVDDDIHWVELGAGNAVRSTMAGLMEPVVELGQTVSAGDVVARVHSLEELDRPAKEFLAPFSGVVAVVRYPALVNVGTTLVNIAVDHGTIAPKGHHVPS